MRNLRSRSVLFVLCSVFILGSCTEEKRKHLAGYHIDFVKNKHKVKQEKSIDPSSETIALARAEENLDRSNRTLFPLSKLQDKPQKLHELKHEKEVITCDRLTLKNGDELAVKVLEITETEVKYKKCDFPDDPTVSISKARVFMIVYSNGTKEVFDATEERFESSTETVDRSDTKLNTLSIIAFIFGVIAVLSSIVPLLGWLFGILAITLGASA